MASIATMTGAQFDALSFEEGRRWELIEGELVEVSSPTPEHQMLVQRILLALVLYVRNRMPALVLADVEFALAGSIRVRPNVWVMFGEKAERLDKSKVPIEGCPDIAIEVISPSERASESMRKVEVYLQHGVREVWQIYLGTRQAVVHTSGQIIRKLAESDTFASDLLPGFELSVSSLFAE
ncbi:MAG TPA: Uma2 family endonuclease [Bryobacteraceae bacterium]|jgi:Uma2 family endonuclease